MSPSKSLEQSTELILKSFLNILPLQARSHDFKVIFLLISGNLWAESSVFQGCCYFFSPHLPSQKVFLMKYLKLVFTILFLFCFSGSKFIIWIIIVFISSLGIEILIYFHWIFYFDVPFPFPVSFWWVFKISNLLNWCSSQYVYLEEEWRHIHRYQDVSDRYWLWKWKNSLFETKNFQILNINLEKKFKFYYLKELEIY